MNTTVSIHLGGSVFNIEEDAYGTLKAYLDGISALFAADPSRAEILEDIEARLAELFSERNNARKSVIVAADVADVMTIMGRPQDYRLDDDGGDATPPPAEAAAPSGVYYNQRKLYRDMDAALLGGVCSGLAHFLGWNLAVVRTLVVVLCFVSFGAAALGYFLVWALVPPAVTASEKLHMRGQSVNIGSIGRIVNEESRAAAKRLGKLGSSVGQNLRAHSARGGRMVLRALGIVFGLLIIAMGSALLIALVVAAAASEVNVFGFNGTSWDMLNRLVFGDDGTLGILAAGVALVVAAPAVALIYAGFKLLLRSPRRVRGLGVSLLALFIIGAGLCAWGGIKTGKNFSRDAELTSTTALAPLKGDTLVLDVMPDDVFIGRGPRYSHDDFDLIKMTRDSVFYGQSLHVWFEPGEAPGFSMEVVRGSHGRNLEEAGALARAIRFHHLFHNDTLSLAPFFTTPATDPYRGQEVGVTIRVPVGKYVRFGKRARWVSWQAEEGEVHGMTDDGLREGSVGADLLDEKLGGLDSMVENIKTGLRQRGSGER